MWTMLNWSDAARVEELPEAVGGVGIRMTKFGGHDTRVEADHDKSQVWVE